MDIEDRVLQAIEEARGCSEGNLLVGSEWDEPFFEMGLQGSMVHRIICRDFWYEVQNADRSEDPEEALRDLVDYMVASVEAAHEEDEEEGEENC